MAEMALAFALSDTKSLVKKPRCIDEEWLFPKSVGIGLGRGIDSIVLIGFESHDRSEKW